MVVAGLMVFQAGFAVDFTFAFVFVCIQVTLQYLECTKHRKYFKNMKVFFTE
jgi:hypothetical protein